MGKINIEIETIYDIGDVVVFKKQNELKVGVVEGYYLDQVANNSIWYNIRTNFDTVYTYNSGGDIGEHDIVMNLYDNTGTAMRLIDLDKIDIPADIDDNIMKDIEEIKSYLTKPE